MATSPNWPTAELGPPPIKRVGDHVVHWMSTNKQVFIVRSIDAADPLYMTVRAHYGRREHRVPRSEFLYDDPDTRQQLADNHTVLVGQLRNSYLRYGDLRQARIDNGRINDMFLTQMTNVNPAATNPPWTIPHGASITVFDPIDPVSRRNPALTGTYINDQPYPQYNYAPGRVRLDHNGALVDLQYNMMSALYTHPTTADEWAWNARVAQFGINRCIEELRLLDLEMSKVMDKLADLNEALQQV